MTLKVTETCLPGVLILEPAVFGDDRGFFFESFNEKTFIDSIGFSRSFVQDNHSKSSLGVLRGLHYQIRQAQGKLVRVVEGAIFDVAIDIRKGSPFFGEWFGVELSAENKKQLWIPPDFAHGFLVTSATAQVLYKATNFYAPEHERSINWSDPEIGIAWPKIEASIVLSNKDLNAGSLKEAELPSYDGQ